MTDDLLNRARAALNGVTAGRAVQFHPDFRPEARGTPCSEWDTSHDVSVILPDGTRRRLATFQHARDAAFYETARDLVPELAAAMEKAEAERRDAALDAIAALGQAQEAYDAQTAAEAENARLREALDEARLEAYSRRHMHAPEDSHVEALCLRYGYGAVMDAASRLWARHDSMGAFYIGGCIGLRDDAEAAALRAKAKEAGE